MQFSAFIKQERTARGWTMQQLATKAHFLPGYISLVENGRKNPRISNALRLCRALGVDVGALARTTEEYKVHGAAKKSKCNKGRSRAKKR